MRDTWRETRMFQGGPTNQAALEPSGFSPGVSERELWELKGGIPVFTVYYFVYNLYG
jgi:hypothetical protein